MSVSKFTCGEITPSGCVLFTGVLPSFIPEDSISCTQTLDEILAAHANKIELLLSGSDLTDLNKGCFDFDPATITIKGLHQKQIDKICSIDSILTQLKQQVDNLNIGQELVTIDLHCLTPVGQACATATNTYSLVTILNILVNEICQLKSQS